MCIRTASLLTALLLMSAAFRLVSALWVLAGVCCIIILIVFARLGSEFELVCRRSLLLLLRPGASGLAATIRVVHAWQIGS